MDKIRNSSGIRRRECGTERLPIRQSLCGRCRYLVGRIKAVEEWDGQSVLEGLKGFTRKRLDDRDPALFAVWRAEFVKQLKQQLAYLNAREILRVKCEALDIEEKVRSLRRRLKRRSDYPPVASAICGPFSKDQYAAVYAILDDIEDVVPSCNVGRAFAKALAEAYSARH